MTWPIIRSIILSVCSCFYTTTRLYLFDSPCCVDQQKKIEQSNPMLKPPELVLETGPLDTWIVGYFTIETANLNAHSSLQLELPKLDATEELKFEFLDQGLRGAKTNT